MNDSTGPMFAKFDVVKNIEWLSKFEKIPDNVKSWAEKQQKEAEEMRSKMVERFNSK